MRRVVLTVFIVLVAAACAPTYGQRGELGFAYGADDAISYVSVRRPLAVGCEAEIVVYAPEKKEESPDIVWGEKKVRSPKRIEVTSARSENTDVLEVVDIDGARVRLRGQTPGETALRVETESGEDVIAVEVAETHHVELDHLAWASRKASASSTVLLRGGTAHFALERKSDDGRTLACYGSGDAVEISPNDGARIVNRARDMGHMRLAVAQPKQLSVVPRASSGYVFETMSPEAVASLDIDFVRSDDERKPLVLDVDDSALLRVHARTRDGRYVLALDGLLELESQTPEVCETASLAQITSDGLYAVRGLDQGTCELTAKLGEQRTSAELPVEQK
jgi:hypothetical protein